MQEEMYDETASHPGPPGSNHSRRFRDDDPFSRRDICSGPSYRSELTTGEFITDVVDPRSAEQARVRTAPMKLIGPVRRGASGPQQRGSSRNSPPQRHAAPRRACIALFGVMFARRC
jgi:hypothetical protein